MKENELYNIDCNNIEDILIKKKEQVIDVTVKNDKKYRDLRKMIMIQNKKLEEKDSQIKILEELLSKENNINLNNKDNYIMNLFKN